MFKFMYNFTEQGKNKSISYFKINHNFLEYNLKKNINTIILPWNIMHAREYWISYEYEYFVGAPLL